MPRAARFQDWIALFILTVFWGSAFLLTEIALRALDPSALVFMRIALGSAFLLVYVLLSGSTLPTSVAGWTSLSIMALLGLVLPFHLVAWAQLVLDSSTTGVLMATMPLIVLVLAHYTIPGSTLTPARIRGFVIGFIGVLFVIGPLDGSELTNNATFFAALGVLGAVVSYALNTIYVRRKTIGNPVGMSAGMLVFGSLLTLPTAIAAQPEVPVPLPALAAAAALGLLSTGLASVLYFRLVQGPGPAFLSLVNYLVPGWAVLLGYFVLGEQPATSTWCGLALILFGVAMSEFGPRLRLIVTRRLVRDVAEKS